MYIKIKKEYPSIKLIVGNTTNVEFLDEIDPYVDAVKVGIASGFACDTKSTAGCYEQQFSAVWKFKERSKQLGLPIISDGGVREYSDLVKAIGAGANSIMVGSFLAACPESAAELNKEKTHKIYAGMASEYVQNNWKGGLKPGTCAEGSVKLLKIGPSVVDMINNFQGALRTGITYGGGIDIKSFQQEVKFIELT
jgi:hypothetical protein